MEAAHRFFVLGDLRDLDAIEALRRIEQRQRARVPELRTCDRAELRGVEVENPRVSLRCRTPIGHDIGNLVYPLYRANRIALMMGAEHRVDPERGLRIQIELTRRALEAHIVRIKMSRRGIEIID